jgi:hypothetical protein
MFQKCEAPFTLGKNQTEPPMVLSAIAVFFKPPKSATPDGIGSCRDRDVLR